MAATCFGLNSINLRHVLVTIMQRGKALILPFIYQYLLFLCNSCYNLMVP